MQKGGHDNYLLGFFIADAGNRNRLVHLWKFADDAGRRSFWSSVYANKEFDEGFASRARPLLVSQKVKLLHAAPWAPHP